MNKYNKKFQDIPPHPKCASKPVLKEIKSLDVGDISAFQKYFYEDFHEDPIFHTDQIQIIDDSNSTLPFFEHHGLLLFNRLVEFLNRSQPTTQEHIKTLVGANERIMILRDDQKCIDIEVVKNSVRYSFLKSGFNIPNTFESVESLLQSIKLFNAVDDTHTPSTQKRKI